MKRVKVIPNDFLVLRLRDGVSVARGNHSWEEATTEGSLLFSLIPPNYFHGNTPHEKTVNFSDEERHETHGGYDHWIPARESHIRLVSMNLCYHRWSDVYNYIHGDSDIIKPVDDTDIYTVKYFIDRIEAFITRLVCPKCFDEAAKLGFSVPVQGERGAINIPKTSKILDRLADVGLFGTRYFTRPQLREEDE